MLFINSDLLRVQRIRALSHLQKAQSNMDWIFQDLPRRQRFLTMTTMETSIVIY